MRDRELAFHRNERGATFSRRHFSNAATSATSRDYSATSRTRTDGRTESDSQPARQMRHSARSPNGKLLAVLRFKPDLPYSARGRRLPSVLQKSSVTPRSLTIVWFFRSASTRRKLCARINREFLSPRIIRYPLRYVWIFHRYPRTRVSRSSNVCRFRAFPRFPPARKLTKDTHVHV